MYLELECFEMAFFECANVFALFVIYFCFHLVTLLLFFVLLFFFFLFSCKVIQVYLVCDEWTVWKLLNSIFLEIANDTIDQNWPWLGIVFKWWKRIIVLFVFVLLLLHCLSSFLLVTQWKPSVINALTILHVPTVAHCSRIPIEVTHKTCRVVK